MDAIFSFVTLSCQRMIKGWDAGQPAFYGNGPTITATGTLEVSNGVALQRIEARLTVQERDAILAALKTVEERLAREMAGMPLVAKGTVE